MFRISIMKLSKNKNSQDNENEESPIFNYLVAIGIVGFLSIVIVAAVFYLHIEINETFKENQRNRWVAFGEFFGGILSPTLAFFALIALLFSINYQVTEFQKSTKQLEESAIALKSQNELIQQQNLETINIRFKETEINKIDATNKLIIEALDCFQNLQNIKLNYIDKLDDNPIRRLICVPSMLIYYHPSNPGFANLYYLAKTIPKTPEDQALQDNRINSANN